MYESVGRLGARKVRVSFMYRWADRATHKMGLRDQGVMGRGHEEVPPWSRHRKLVVWAWSLKKGGPSRLFKGWLCGLGDEDKYSPLKTLDDFTTAVTILEIMINGPCLSFTAEIFFYKWWRHTLYIPYYYYIWRGIIWGIQSIRIKYCFLRSVFQYYFTLHRSWDTREFYLF